MTEFLRGFGPQLDRLYGHVVTILVHLMTLQKRSLSLPLETFPGILPGWVEVGELEEAALKLLRKTINIIGMELAILQREEREPTHKEIHVLRKHLYQVNFCLFIIAKINELRRESIMPGSFTGDLMAVRAPNLSREARKKVAERLLQKHLKGKPLPYRRFMAIRQHIMKEISQLMVLGNLTRDEAMHWWAMPFIPDAAEELAEVPLIKLIEGARELKNAMSRLVTKALLGPGWSIRDRHEKVSKELPDPSTASDRDPPVITVLELETVLSLLPADVVFLFEAIAAGKSQIEVAAELGIKAEAARQKVSRARKKIKSLYNS